MKNAPPPQGPEGSPRRHQNLLWRSRDTDPEKEQGWIPAIHRPAENGVLPAFPDKLRRGWQNGGFGADYGMGKKQL